MGYNYTPTVLSARTSQHTLQETVTL